MYFVYERTHKGYPWLTQKANVILEDLLLKTDKVLEFGSGRSTVWFSDRVGMIVSVEHNEEWYGRVKSILDAGYANVDYRLVKKGMDDQKSLGERYVAAAGELGPGSVDIVLVDGIFRSECAILAVNVLSRGGVLILDNVNRYLPSNSRAPDSIALDGKPVDDNWRKFAGLTSGWRRIWTTNGLTDTAFLFKP